LYVLFLFRLLIFALKLKYINNRVYRLYCGDDIRPASHKYIRKEEIIQGNLSINAAYVPTEQVSNRKTRNNENRNNQIVTSVPTEEVSVEKFHYKELT
jgi:hypothetical protein